MGQVDLLKWVIIMETQEINYPKHTIKKLGTMDFVSQPRQNC